MLLVVFHQHVGLRVGKFSANDGVTVSYSNLGHFVAISRDVVEVLARHVVDVSSSLYHEWNHCELVMRGVPVFLYFVKILPLR